MTDIGEDSADDGLDGVRGDIDFDAVHEVDVAGFHAVHVDLCEPLLEHLHALLTEPLEFLLEVVVGLEELSSGVLGVVDEILDVVGLLWGLILLHYYVCLLLYVPEQPSYSILLSSMQSIIFNKCNRAGDRRVDSKGI